MERGKHEVRLHEIDVLYGLGTLLAILGHSHPNDWSSFPGKWVEFIYLFHMPLFFLIAGFLLAESKSLMRQSYGKWLWEKAQRLLTPYVVLSLIAMIPKYALEHNGLSGLTPGYLLTAFLMPREGIWGHFWFLQALFWMYAVFGLLRKRMPENSKIGGQRCWQSCLCCTFESRKSHGCAWKTSAIFPCILRQDICCADILALKQKRWVRCVCGG